MKNIIIIAIMLGLVSCGSKPKEAVQQTNTPETNIVHLSKAQNANLKMSFAKPEKRQFSSTLELNGRIDVPPQNLVSISAVMGGYLKSTNMLPGMHVRKGEVLAIMEDQQFVQLQQDYLLTKSKLAYSQMEYARQKELNQSKATSDKVFQLAASERDNLQITLHGLAEKLRLLQINPATISSENISRTIKLYAPINGYVSKVNVNIGKYLSPTDVLFELVNPDDIHLALRVFEKDLGKLFIGQKLLAFNNSSPEKKYPCEIILIGKDFGTDHYTEVHCHFEKYDKSLLPGTFMNASIPVQSETAFVLPEHAIVRSEGKNYVFVQVGDGQFEMHEVQTGATNGGFVALKDADALAEKTVVVEGAY
ncbi:MAG: efflux RND transporter periplasmic adaptor subunit, partial [Chitinophagaceae bacterium]